MTLKVQDLGLQRILKTIKAKNFNVQLGVLEDGPHPDSKLSLAELAAVHEFGAPSVGIPSRAPLRTTLIAESRDLKASMRRAGRQLLKGRKTKRQINEELGKEALEKLRARVEKGLPPPLKDGSGRTPLVKTGALLDAYDYKVVDK